MVTLRCTKKLRDKLPTSAPNAPSNQPSTTLLGDWYITILHARPKHLLMCVSEHSRLIVLFPAAPLSTFVPRLRQSLAQVLRAATVLEASIASELDEMISFQFGPTQSRSHVGTLVEYVKTLEYLDEDSELESALDKRLSLNRMIWRPLEYKTPEEVTRALLEPKIPVSASVQ